MTMSMTLITPDKRKQIVRLLEDGLDKVVLDKSQAQRLIGRGGELQEGLKKLLEDLSVSDRYANEEVESRYGYLSGYKPKGISEQINRLRQLFPHLRTADEKLAEQPLPPNAEGFFAVPRWQKVAATYNEAVETVLAKFRENRGGKFTNHREGQLGPEWLREHVRKVGMFTTLGDQQKGHDVLIVPSQFGLRHRGRSVRRAREVFVGNEFGHGAYEVGMMLLTHPERLQHVDDLWIDCGDEYAPAADGQFAGAPCFSFSVGRVEFGSRDVGRANGYYGSVSGFLPHY